MEISNINELSFGLMPLYSIWIVQEETDDGTFDVNVWDEIENERVEDLEEGHFQSLKEAENRLVRIVEENPEIKFVRLENEKN